MRRLLSFSAIFHFSILLFTSTGLSAQTDSIPSTADTTEIKVPVVFSHPQALEFIEKMVENDETWSSKGDTLRFTLRRLMDQYREPLDSIRARLAYLEIDSLKPEEIYISKRDTLPLRWLTPTAFYVDTVSLEREPVVTQKTIIINRIDSTLIEQMRFMTEIQGFLDSLITQRDTITELIIDTDLLASKKIQLYRIEGNTIDPMITAARGRTVRFLPDSSAIILTHSRRVLAASDDSPFFIISGEEISDSLQTAVSTILDYTYKRDSILLSITDLSGRNIPFWLTVNDEERHRFWVKNQANDSITIWIGNPSKYDISLILEDNVNVGRREKKLEEDLPITTLRPVTNLATLSPLQEIPVYWNYGFGSSFTLNQTYLSNWARGGENSLASMLDVSGIALYTNKATNSQWTNGARLRYGSIITEEHGFRTNTDNFEINSQYNRKMLNKIDFSTVFYFKTQVAKGFNYPNDSVVVSKFLNPGTFTVGVGVEYKPFPKTRINFSPLSYRNTFVLDTANINQKIHGIDIDKRSKQEMGGQLVIVNSMEILKGITMANNVRLFSGYLDKPENVDIDWEISLEKQINWFFSVKLHLHSIYDDDVLFVIENKDGEPILTPDGEPKRVPKLQLKQFLGLTLSFKL